MKETIAPGTLVYTVNTALSAACWDTDHKSVNHGGEYARDERLRRLVKVPCHTMSSYPKFEAKGLRPQAITRCDACPPGHLASNL